MLGALGPQQWNDASEVRGVVFMCQERGLPLIAMASNLFANGLQPNRKDPTRNVEMHMEGAEWL